MSYTIKYNRNTNHIAGVSERTRSNGGDKGGSVTYYAQSTCSVLSSSPYLATGKSFERLADAVAALERPQDRKACKKCLAAAKAQIEAEKLMLPEITHTMTVDTSAFLGALKDAMDATKQKRQQSR
jgi:hypothetical protein